MTDACPICYEFLSDRTVYTCPKCHQNVCDSCARAIRRSTKISTACPLCRHDWRPIRPIRSRTDFMRWRRRAQMTRQLIEWMVLDAGASQTPANADTGYEAAAAITQFILMGVWMWNTTAD